MQFHQNVIALFLVASLSVGAAAGDKMPDSKPAQKDGSTSNCQKSTIAKGTVVSELDKAIWHVFQAKNNDYWFGSHDRGAYRYDGRTLVNFTTKDGLASNSIGGFQEDKAGNIYISNHGISKFDGRTITMLKVSAQSAKTDWKLRPEDLWFPGPKNSGAAYRYDGKWLHPLAFPTTKDGDDHYREVPRDKYPNAKYSPYDVFSIFKDSKGHVWFGTAILGACRYDGKSFLWIPESELRNGSFGTRSIVEDKDGKFWFCNTVHRYEIDAGNPAEPKFKRVDGIGGVINSSGERIGGIMSSVLDRAGALWFATYGQAVWRYDGKIAIQYPVKDAGKDIHLFSIHQDNQGVMWLGTQTSGVYKLNGKKFEQFRP